MIGGSARARPRTDNNHEDHVPPGLVRARQIEREKEAISEKIS